MALFVLFFKITFPAESITFPEELMAFAEESMTFQEESMTFPQAFLCFANMCLSKLHFFLVLYGHSEHSNIDLYIILY